MTFNEITGLQPKLKKKKKKKKKILKVKQNTTMAFTAKSCPYGRLNKRD